VAAASGIKGHRGAVRRGSLSLLDQPPIFPFKLSYGLEVDQEPSKGLVAWDLSQSDWAGILLGSVLQRTLPTSQLSPESKEVVKLSLGIVATLSALVLGLLVASAKTTYSAREGEINEITTYVILLNNLLASAVPLPHCSH
jgi:hypothetical protein